MHWTGAERTAPLNAPSPIESTKQSLKEGGREGIGGGRGMSRSLAYLLYNLLKWGWDLASASSCSIFYAYSALGGGGGKNRDGRELMTSSSIIKVSRG